MIYVYEDEKQSGKYYFQLTDEDFETCKIKKYKKRGFSCEKEARKAAMNYISEQDTRKFNGLKFDFIIQDFLKLKRQRLSETRVQRFDRIFRLYLSPYLANKYMNRFSALDAEKFYNHIFDLNLSVNYTNWILSQFKRIFRYSEIYYNLANNPASRLEYSKEAIQPIDPLDLSIQRKIFKVYQRLK